MNLSQLILGIGLGITVAAGAYLTGVLTLGGALASALAGGLTFGLGGFGPALLLILFFVTSSTLSRLGSRKKRSLASTFAKGGRRDHVQVLANGLLATILASFHGLTGDPIWLIGMVGALAAATADTWATELGVLARKHPRLVTTGEIVEPGTSGAVSLEGSLASLLGAGMIGVVGALVLGDILAVPAALIGGVGGAFVDSFLGATEQLMYYCPSCDKPTEWHPIHSCGERTSHVRGRKWLGNDQVNFVATLVGAVGALVFWVVV